VHCLGYVAFRLSPNETHSLTISAMFELVSTFPIDPLMIFYRWHKNKSQILPYLCAACGIWGLSFTLAEIATTIFLLHESWNMWSLPFQTITPIVFSIWCGAQFKYCHTMYGIYLTQRKALEQFTPSGSPSSPITSDRKDLEMDQSPV
jgi:hypothetical protein